MKTRYGVALALAAALGSAAPAWAGYPHVVAGQAPLEYYRLDTTTGENGDTLAANGVAINQASPAPTLTGPAFAGFSSGNTWANFDGSPSATLTDLATGWGSGAGSISYWYRLDPTGPGTQTGVFANPTGGGTIFGATDMIGTFTRLDGSLGIIIDGVTTQTGAGQFTTNTWHHYAATWDRDAGRVTVYLDGEIVAHSAGAAWDDFEIVAARFGKEIGGATRQLDGSADELAIFGGTLRAMDVAAQHQAAVNGTRLVAAFDFSDLTPGANDVLPSANMAGGGAWSVSSIDTVGISHGADDTLRDSNGAALPSTALVLSPQSIDGTNPPGAPLSSNDYLEFSVTNNSGSAPRLLDLLTFDWGLSSDQTSGLIGKAQLFASVDGGSVFDAIGPEFMESVGAAFSGLIRYEVDLSGLGAIGPGGSVIFRLAFSDNSGAFTSDKAHYVDNVFVFAQVPAPGALPAGLALLVGVGIRRRRARR